MSSDPLIRLLYDDFWRFGREGGPDLHHAAVVTADNFQGADDQTVNFLTQQAVKAIDPRAGSVDERLVTDRKRRPFLSVFALLEPYNEVRVKRARYNMAHHFSRLARQAAELCPLLRRLPDAGAVPKKFRVPVVELATDPMFEWLVHVHVRLDLPMVKGVGHQIFYTRRNVFESSALVLGRPGVRRIHADQAEDVEEVAEQEANETEAVSVAHSPDFRSVEWYGTQYHFTAAQAKVVQVLWSAWEAKAPDVGDETLLQAVDPDAPPQKLNTLFRESTAWNTMIVRGGTKGSHRLALTGKSPESHR